MSFSRSNFHVTVDLRLCEFSICLVFKSIQDLGVHCKIQCFDVMSATKTNSEKWVHETQGCILITKPRVLIESFTYGFTGTFLKNFIHHSICLRMLL